MLNKENKKIMEVFFARQINKCRSSCLSDIYINCASWYTDNILGLGGVGTLPQMLEVLGAIPK